MGWTTTPDGKCYLNGKLIRYPKSYGAKMRRGFLRREREKDDKRPIHFSLDAPIDPRYNKPIQQDRHTPRANYWGMPLADGEKEQSFEFYERRLQLFIEYARKYAGLSKSETEWLSRMLWVIFGCVHEHRENGPKAVRRAVSDTIGVAIRDGRMAKFVDLYRDIAATPGWYAISREGATIEEGLAINHAARHLWEHPRVDHLRRGFRSFIPKRAHRRKKK